jgi:hypothetical protein
MVVGKKTLIESFWGKVRPQVDGCWLWNGAKTYHGYGYVQRGNKPTRAHRISWEIHFGQIPDGLEVAHRCDVRHCVRPDHLFLATHAENIADMVSKGRQSRHGLGGDFYGGKIDAETAEKIRSEYISGRGGNRKEMAKKYGLCTRQVSLIGRGNACRGRHWD